MFSGFRRLSPYPLTFRKILKGSGGKKKIESKTVNFLCNYNRFIGEYILYIYERIGTICIINNGLLEI